MAFGLTAELLIKRPKLRRGESFKMESNAIAHHGIKGQKWGVRRYQNSDGSRTSLGLAHDREIYAQQTGSSGQHKESSGPKKKSISFDKEKAKTVGKVVLATATVAAAAYAYSRNKSAIDSMVSNAGNNIASKFAKSKNVEAGDAYLKKMFSDSNKNHSLQYKLAKTKQRLDDYNSPDSQAKRMAERIAKANERTKQKYQADVAKAKLRAERNVRLKAELDKIDIENGLDPGYSYNEYINSLPSTKIKKAVSSASKAANTVQNAANKTAKSVQSTARNVSNRTNAIVKRVSSAASKPEQTKWQKTKSKAKRKVATAAVAAVARKKMDRVMEAKLYGDRKLAQKKEENRHQEEMARIKKGKRK